MDKPILNVCLKPIMTLKSLKPYHIVSAILLVIPNLVTDKDVDLLSCFSSAPMARSLSDQKHYRQFLCTSIYHRWRYPRTMTTIRRHLSVRYHHLQHHGLPDAFSIQLIVSHYIYCSEIVSHHIYCREIVSHHIYCRKRLSHIYC